MAVIDSWLMPSQVQFIPSGDITKHVHQESQPSVREETWFLRECISLLDHEQHSARQEVAMAQVSHATCETALAMLCPVWVQRNKMGTCCAQPGS